MGQITFKDMLMFVFLSTLIRKTAANQGRCIIQSIYCIQEIWVRAFRKFGYVHLADFIPLSCPLP